MSADAPGPGERAVAAALFVATLASCVATYAFVYADPEAPARARLLEGLAFGGSLLAILLAHEAGHYVVARRHGFALSLPWFIPFPNLFGTLGALIRLRSLPRSRAALLEMGAAGPLAGAVVAFVLLWVSIPWMGPAASLPPGTEVWIFQDPPVLRLLAWLRTGQTPDPLAHYHPVMLAGWVGCFLTGLNLLPVGQLDGGHVLNGLSPALARFASRAVPVGMVLAGYWWPGWALLGLLLLVLPAGRPLPVPAGDGLPLRARLVSTAVALLFAATFLPTPLVQTTIGGSP